MNTLFTTLALAAANVAAQSVDANTLPDVDFSNMVLNTFEAKIDNRLGATTGTFALRYWVDDTYWVDSKSPNFIYFCGEYVCEPPAERHYPFQVGANMGARLFVIEHRFYGESQPAADWSTTNLELLNSEQALADFANFLTVQNADMPTRQTIVIGGSYPGALSAWFRYKYPAIATASWASSAVVQPWADMWTYDEQIYDSTHQISPVCALTLQKFQAYGTTQAILRNAGENNQITDILVGTPGVGMPTDDFLAFMGDIPAGFVQYGHATQFCAVWDDYADLPEQDLFTAVIYSSFNEGEYPWDYSTAPGSKITDTTIDTTYSGRQWTWQYCREFGWFQVASKLHQERSKFVDEQYFENQCSDVFDLDMTVYPDISLTETQYGGGNKIDSTNTFFANGREDPWKWVTQLENRPDINQLSVVSECQGCGHCCELYTPVSTDPTALKNTRQQIYDWIYAILHPSVADLLQ